ncbi:MAG: MogA/MoaB family molybdenum cofactor biosynthesis protein [Rhodothermales bacterium]
MSYEEHKDLSDRTPVRAAVITVSDTRTRETDTSGRFLVKAFETAGIDVVDARIVADEIEEIEAAIDELSARCEVIVTNGGTGISLRDTTIEVVTRKFDKELPGFGELFRMLSYDEIGSGAMLSRAAGGLFGDVLLFALPGSTNAVRLAAEQLILPEIEHLVWEVIRQRP